MEIVFVLFGAYWIIDSLIPEPQVCWREVVVEDGRIGTNVPCTEEELKILKVGE